MANSLKTLVITDSRGVGLYQKIKQLNDEGEIDVSVNKGAGVEKAVGNAIVSYAKCNSKVLVIVMAGICDITVRDKNTGQTSLRSLSEGQMVDKAFLAITNAYQMLLTAGYINISVATITGIELDDYNSRKTKYLSQGEYTLYCTMGGKTTHPDQDLLNRTVLQLNRLITGLNRNNDMPTTWTASAVHSYFRSAYHHYYRKLYDGCHPRETTTVEWAKKVTMTMGKVAAKLSKS